MNIMTVEESILNEKAWLDIGGHYYCVETIALIQKKYY